MSDRLTLTRAFEQRLDQRFAGVDRHFLGIEKQLLALERLTIRGGVIGAALAGLLFAALHYWPPHG